MLIENGAKVDVGDSFGLTPLHLAAFDGRVDMIRLLLRCGHFCQTSYPISTIPRKHHNPRGQMMGNLLSLKSYDVEI